jgi:hypothetical protein
MTTNGLGDGGTRRREDGGTGSNDEETGPEDSVHRQLVPFQSLSGGESSVLSHGPLHVSRCSQSLD